MTKYDIIAFDLDGTLTNPERGLLASFKYAHEKMGIPYASLDSMKRFIGPPLYDEWQKCYGITPEESSRMLLIFREFYEVYGWWDNEVYPGIPELLVALRSRGARLAVATSKPEHFAKRILRKFGIAEYFEFIGGAASDKSRDKKIEVLEYVLSALGSPDRSSVILVGDRKYDAEGARLAGIDSLGVAYGHGTREELLSAGFSLLADTPEDVLRLIG